ncbi:MAG TPA: DUF4249 domain-containing protein [Chitinophagaceae bacterium]|nr:DUF4249 domain-containing protein [Chitinophagaceae bacterium]
MTDKKLSRSFRLTGLFALLALIGLSSCEKVIDINLNKAEKRYVVEAIVNDQSGARVLLSQTKDFEDDNSFAGVSGAVVEITENGGAATTLSETTAGMYEAPALIGSVGKTYSLSVKVNGQSFTAVSTMPQKVNLDTIYITDEFLFGDTRKIVNLEYKDPPGRGQYYRFVQYLNGRKETEIFVQNDEYTDGRNVTNKLFYFPDDDEDYRKIKSGDQVRIEMFCTDANVYKYWYSLYRSATGESQATPSNPVSNMKGGALGYFSAQTSQAKTMIAP